MIGHIKKLDLSQDYSIYIVATGRSDKNVPWTKLRYFDIFPPSEKFPGNFLVELTQPDQLLFGNDKRQIHFWHLKRFQIIVKALWQLSNFDQLEEIQELDNFNAHQ